MAQKPDYRYTPVPTNLMLCLDNNCRSVLFTLIQLSTFFQSVNNDFDGWFYRSNSDLEAETRLSRRVLDGALDALYKAQIIEIIPQQKGQGVKQETRKYKVNSDAFHKYESLSIEECYKNPEVLINTSDYKKQAPSFNRTTTPTSIPASTPTSSLTSTPTSGKSTNNIYNVDIINNNDNIDKDKILNTNKIYLSNSRLSSFNNKELNDVNESEHQYFNDQDKAKPSYLKSIDETPGGGEDKEYNISKLDDSEPTPVPKEDIRVAPAIKREPTTETSIAQYDEHLFTEAVFQLVDMERGVCKKDDKVFYRAADLYGLLYGIIDRKEACKEVQLIVNELVKDTQTTQ